jgi:hypothetical protein
MSEIENSVLERFFEALSLEDTIPLPLLEELRVRIVREGKLPTAERLAELIFQHTGDPEA